MKISIITPTFNREDCIVRCLDSVTRQLVGLPHDVEVEHVVVDDGSGDSSAEIIRRYAAEHKHIKFIAFSENRGVAAARNAAVAVAGGEWCLLLDSDDWQSDDALVRMADVVRRNPGYHHYMFTDDDCVDDVRKYGEQAVFTFDDFLQGRVTGDFVHLIDREVMLRYPYDEHLRIYESLTLLRFYKATGGALFTNHVVHMLERNRCDSVSLTFVRYNNDIIMRKRRHAEKMLEFFESDMRERGMEGMISDLHLEIADNALLMGDYEVARRHLRLCRPSVMKRVLGVVVATRQARLYKWMLQRYLSVKHRRPERGVQ